MSEQNWGRRVVDSRGGHFRIETGSPRQGRDGPEPVSYTHLRAHETLR